MPKWTVLTLWDPMNTNVIIDRGIMCPNGLLSPVLPLPSNSSQNVLPKKMGGHLGGRLGGHLGGMGGHFRLFVCCLNLLIYVSNWSIMYVGWVLYHFYIFFTLFFLFLSLTLKIFNLEYFSKLSKQYIYFYYCVLVHMSNKNVSYIL